MKNQRGAGPVAGGRDATGGGTRLSRGAPPPRRLARRVDCRRSDPPTSAALPPGGRPAWHWQDDPLRPRVDPPRSTPGPAAPTRRRRGSPTWSNGSGRRLLGRERLERTHVAEVLAQLTPGSKTVVRLQLMHWTGMRPSQMGRLQPEDFRLDESTPFVVVPRGKGGRLAAIAIRLAEPAGSVDRLSVNR